jgi:hypothetical protein
MMVQTTETGCLYENILLCQRVFECLFTQHVQFTRIFIFETLIEKDFSTSLSSPCEIFGGPRDTETGVSLTNWVFHCRYD